MYRFRDTLPIDISEQTISGDLVTIENPEEMGVIDALEVSLEPIQDLNGYDNPWVGGAGKNLLGFSAINSTLNGVTFVSTGEKISITGTATANTTPYSGDESTAWATARYGPYPAGQYTVEAKGFTPSQSTDRIVFNGVYEDGSRIEQFPSGARINEGAVTFTASAPFKCGIWLFITNGSTINASSVEAILNKGSAIESWTPYSNICPISGRTEADTHRTGKNLAQFRSIDETKLGITWKSDGSSIRAIGTATSESNPFNASDVTNYQTMLNGEYPAGTYTLSCRGWTPSNTNDRLIAHAKYADGSRVAGAYGTRISPSTIGGQPNDITFTATAPFKLDFWASITSGSTVDFTATIQLEVGSTATAYEPYQGTTYTTALGRTVYGGTLDVVSGSFANEYAEAMFRTGYYTLTGPIGASGVYPNTYVYYNTTLGGLIEKNMGGDVTKAVCNYLPSTSRTLAGNKSAVGIFQYHEGDVNQFRIAFPHEDRFSTSAKVRAWLDALEEPFAVVYPLATPQTYQLTPQQIDLLLGTNHLWSDGEISVVWHKDLTKGRILPTEAVSINGQYIENVLDGYRTLYTKGRESLGAELNTYSVGTADGEKFKNKRYPARELTVGFQLIGENAEDFREKFNNLNNLLSLDEADFIFHDEEDKFFSGYPIMNAEVEAGENSVKGEWKIYCAYPFKRSVDPITLTMADATVANTTATFTIDYKGSQPARPVLRAKFAGAKSGGTSSEDGDCGFVAFMDARENIIQLGNPDVLDLDAYAKAGNLINYEFINTSGWTMTGGHRYKGTVTGTVATSDAVDAFWDGGAGQTQSYAKPSYGSGTGLHGSILWKNTAGASNFTLSAVHRLCVNNSNEVGVFELGAYNHSTGKMTAGFVIDKSGNGTTGTVRYIVNAKQVGTDQIDLSYYNTHFGYCNRTPVYVTQKYKKKTWVKVKVKVRRNKYKTKSKVKWVTKTRKVLKRYNYTQSNLNSSIKKDGINVYFQVGNLPRRTFNVPEIEQIVSHDASCYMGTYGTEMNTNMIHSMIFRKETGAVFAEQPNVFTAGDIVEADCNEATVNIYRAGSIGGHLEPQYGALGNDWESFKLTSGENIIRATWSDWVNPTYKPQIEIEYNEVFI